MIALLPWALGLLALPLTFLPGAWSLVAIPAAVALIITGDWLIWTRSW